MDVVTAAEMRLLDERATVEFGIPGIVLMENAGLRVAEAVRHLWRCRRVTVLAGRGNNGGDGLVAARHLRREMAVSIWLAAPPASYRGDALTNLTILQRLGHTCRVADSESSFADLARELSRTDLVVDALLGTGLTRQAESPYAEMIRLVNASGAPVLAVDIPSGVCADSGRVSGEAIRADVTITFALPKRGLLLFPGATHAGRLEVADIGIPEQLLSSHAFVLLTKETVRRLLPDRPPDGHKGTFGRVLLVAGSPGMAGAVVLAARAVLRGGAGLVIAAVPRGIQQVVAVQAPEVITLALPENRRGNIAPEALDLLRQHWPACQTVAVGPGLSDDEESGLVLAGILKDCLLPVALDAGALNLLARRPAAFLGRAAGTVLTPHPGEAARLLGCDTATVQADRPTAVRELAVRLQGVAVLKGAHTLITAPAGPIALNVTGNSGMASAGSGDVLTGLLAALLAQGLKPVDSARLAVYLHGLAGDLAASARGEAGMVAGDIVEMLPQAYLELKKINI
ncbi:MAG: NAD(P)H-hydrate dehydratase [Dethiobacter sp.]|nr:NAD(P)H-hydrate dehydratase [Dethiobacter sp.]